jgi:hypothetical protein
VFYLNEQSGLGGNHSIQDDFSIGILCGQTSKNVHTRKQKGNDFGLNHGHSEESG